MGLARADSVHADSLGRMIERHAAGHLHDSTLAGAIGDESRFTVEAPFGRRIHDAAASLRTHLLEGSATHEEHGTDVDCQSLVPGVIRCRECRALMQDTGIVDEDVETAEALDSLGHQTVALGTVGQVRLAERGGSAVCFNLGADCSSPFFVAPGNEHPGPLCGKGTGACLADPGGRTGDQN